MACAVALPSVLWYSNASKACEELSAQLPVITTFKEQEDIDHRRKLVNIYKLFILKVFELMFINMYYAEWNVYHLVGGY
jgi:hypothetical protein